MKSMMLIAAMLVSTLSFAVTPTSGTHKSSSQVKALNSALHAYHHIQPTLNKNDIEVGYYGGEDISHSHSITGATAVA
jgi:hypothetical protein